VIVGEGRIFRKWEDNSGARELEKENSEERRKREWMRKKG